MCALYATQYKAGLCCAQQRSVLTDDAHCLLLQDLNHLRKAISKKADKEAVEADLDRIHQALRCKANVHAMSEALSQKLDIHSYLTASASTSKIGAYDPSPSSTKRGLKA